MTKELDMLRNNTDRTFAILMIRQQDFAKASQAFVNAFQMERNHYHSLLGIHAKRVRKEKKEVKKKHAK